MLSGAKYISALDAMKGFHQIPIADSCQHYTAFATHRGLFEYSRTPFGLKNSPATFQRAMDVVFHDELHAGWLRVYIDNILVYSPTFEAHLEHLAIAFSKLEASGFSLSLKKCRFAFEDLHTLGHKVSGLQVAISDNHVKAVQDWPTPHDRKAVQHFIGFAIYDLCSIMLTSLQFQVAFIALMSSGLAQNQRFNRFPTIVALWLYAHGTHRHVIELFCKISLSISYHSLQQALKSLALENIKFIHTVLRNETAFFASGIRVIICFDNLDHNATGQEQCLDKKSRFTSGITGYIIVARNVPLGTLDPLPWLQARGRSTIQPEDLHVSAQDHAEIQTNWASALIDFLAEACPPVAAADRSTFLQASPSTDALDPNAPATDPCLEGPGF
jgi:hypothetical protein